MDVDDDIPSPNNTSFELVPSLPGSAAAMASHDGAMSHMHQVMGEMDDRTRSEMYMQMVRGENATAPMQEAAEAAVAGMPWNQHVQNHLAMARINVMNINASQPNNPDQNSQAEELRRLFNERYVSARNILEEEFQVEMTSYKNQFKMELDSAARSTTSEAESAYSLVRKEAEDVIEKLKNAMEEQRLSYQQEFTQVTAEQKAKAMKENNQLQGELKESLGYIRHAEAEASREKQRSDELQALLEDTRSELRDFKEANAELKDLREANADLRRGLGDANSGGGKPSFIPPIALPSNMQFGSFLNRTPLFPESSPSGNAKHASVTGEAKMSQGELPKASLFEAAPPPSTLNAHFDLGRDTGYPSPFRGAGAMPGRKERRGDQDGNQEREKERKFVGGGGGGGPPGPPDHGDDGDDPFRTPEDEFAQSIRKAILEGFKNLKNQDEGKPKAKEADKVELPEFPSPEKYRTWRTAVREAIRSASDDPDGAFQWVLKVYEVREDKATLAKELGDPGKFKTLDTKLLSALTRVAKGELSQQILNFKEVEASQGRIVRGRQVLLMFDQHFKTSEEAGALYGTEDLLKVKLDGDDLKSFLSNWEAVLVGMSHVPDPATLKDLFYREVRNSRKLRYDLDVYERALDGTKDKSYDFLVTAVRRYLDRERLRTNRDKVSQAYSAKYANPAASSQDRRARSPTRNKDPKNSSSKPCYTFDKTGQCKYGNKCKFSHSSRDAKGRSNSKGSSRGRSGSNKSSSTSNRSRSGSGSGSGSRRSSRASSRGSGKGSGSDKPKGPCKYYAKGNCRRGDTCPYSHEDKAMPAPKRRSPSPSARKSKDKKHKKEKKEKKEKRDKSPKSTPCIQNACVAKIRDCTAPVIGMPAKEKCQNFEKEATVKGKPCQDGKKASDYWELSEDGSTLTRHHVRPRNTTFNPETKESCPVPLKSLIDKYTMVVKRRGRSPKETTRKWRTSNRRKFDFDFVGKSVFRVKRVRFDDKPSVTKYEVETIKYRHEKSKTGNTKVFGDASNCPKGSEEDCQDAIDAAASLRRALDESDRNLPACHFLCDHDPEGPDDLCCNKCRIVGDFRIPKCARVNALPSTYTEKWLGDTGTDQDIVGKQSRTVAKAGETKKAADPVSLSTANGSITTDEVVEVNLPGLCESFTPYVLENTPPALSIGLRCLEQGYDFVWGKDTTPIFVRPDGKCVKFKMAGRVPYIDESCQPFEIPEAHLTRLTKALDAIHQYTLNEGLAMASKKEEEPAAGVIADANEEEDIGEEEGEEEEEKELDPIVSDDDEPMEMAIDHDAGDDEGPVGEKTEKQLREEAKSKLHQFTHRPKNPYCDVCNQAKMLAPYGRKVGGSKHVIARGFGDHIVADHVIPKNVEKGIEGQTSMLIIKDVYTQFRYVYPADSKSADSIVRAFQHFLRTVDDVGIVYTDNAPELIDAIEQLGYRHQTSVEYQQSTKAVVEREVRTILEGARPNLHQANMPLSMWPHACRHHATALNAVKQLNGDDAPWSIRYRKDFEGLEVPFGCLVFFWEGKPEPTKGKFAPNGKKGVFLGYHIQSGHVWRGEYLVANLDGLSFFLEDGHVKLIRTKRIAIPDGDYLFPLNFKEKPEMPDIDWGSDDYSPENSDGDDDQDGDNPDQPDARNQGREKMLAIEDKPKDEADASVNADAIDQGGDKEREAKAVDDAIAQLEAEAEQARKESRKPKKGKDKEYSLFEMFYDPTVDPKRLPDGRKTPDGFVWDGMRLVRERKGSKRVPGFPSDLWTNLSPKQRKAEWERYQSELKKKESVDTDVASVTGVAGSSTDKTLVAVPAMPVEQEVYEPHRSELRELLEDKVKELEDSMSKNLFSEVARMLCKPHIANKVSAVARVLNKKEIQQSKDAQASLDKEWDKLLKKGTWDNDKVKECRKVISEAIKKGEKIHIGRIFEICTLKGSELPEGNPQRKYKGRTCFQGKQCV